MAKIRRNVTKKQAVKANPRPPALPVTFSRGKGGPISGFPGMSRTSENRGICRFQKGAN
jgi:hypothetical protein